MSFAEALDQKWSQNVNISLEGKYKRQEPNSSQKWLKMVSKCFYSQKINKAKMIHFIVWPFLAILPPLLAILATTATPQLKIYFYSRIRFRLAKSKSMQNYSMLLDFDEGLEQKLSQDFNILLECKNRHQDSKLLQNDFSKFIE